jgi:hypothetical protein
MHHPNPLLSLSHDQRSTPPRLTIRERKCLKRFFNEVYSPGSFYQVNGTRTPRPHHRQAPIRQHPKISNVHIYQAVQKEKKPSGVKENRTNKGIKILGCYDFSATSPSTGASSSTAVDLVALVPLVPLLPGGGIILVTSYH